MMRFFKDSIDRTRRVADKKAYICGGKKPWSRGYNIAKFDFIKDVLGNKALMEKFKSLDRLPDKYGYAYDERVIEYPWTLSRISSKKGRLLDAGSVFNFKEVIENPIISNKNLTIFTLVPERDAFWNKGISYSYGDLRELPFKDSWFDEVCSLSTLEHVGMDNRQYTRAESSEKIGLEAKKAANGLVRVLKSGGSLFISVPFGRHQVIEWDGRPFLEQFDSPLLKGLLGVFSSCQSVRTHFYKYTKDGWNISTEEKCQDAEYFNIHTTASYDADYAAAARAAALIEVVK
ncbi:MAG: methyltransferase domain-containing protein [Planctomycetota bacterium]|jgi:hypothetical protein